MNEGQTTVEAEKERDRILEKDKTFSVVQKKKKKLTYKEEFLDIVEVESYKIYNLKMTFCEWGTTSDDPERVTEEPCKQLKECLGRCLVF